MNHFGALDKQLREQMQYEIKELHEKLEVTIVYVTHDQSEALTMSNRIAVFDDGIIQQLAPPNVLYESPENAFVAQFIGENNTLSGKVTAIDKEICTVEVGENETLRALAVNIEGIGSNTMISLRPERVVVNPENGSYPNIVSAEVIELIYLGDHIRSRMKVCGHDDFIVKIPNSAHHAQLKPGNSVKVGWMSEDARALDALE
jgi:ABC-type spermidine/putrescine transport systems, ATPase components